jgi:hypothetical protein
MNKQSLGFIFGFKKTTQEGNSFVVKFTQGTSKKFPKEHQKERDFWSQEIFIGDKSDLFYDPDLYIKGFEAEFANWDDSSLFECLEERKSFYKVVPTFDQYKVLHAFSQASLHMWMYQTWESKDAKEETFMKVAGRLCNFAMMEDHESACAAAYDKSIADFAAEFNK